MANESKIDKTLEPVLNDEDLQSQMWLKRLKPHLESRLESMRNALEADVNDVKTATLRGRIREIRSFLKLGTPQKFENSEPPTY